MGGCILATTAASAFVRVSQESHGSVSWNNPVHGSHLYLGPLYQIPIRIAPSFPLGGPESTQTVLSTAGAE